MGMDEFRLKCILGILCLIGILSAQSGAKYLVITPDYFYNTLQPLIKWKYKKGMKPAVYKLSQIGSDSASIKNFIQNCYNTWDIKPRFLVLVGHPGFIPMFYYQYGPYHYYTDNYYTNMDGDIYNEIIPGRLSVADTFQLKTIIAKIFTYERHPLTSDSLWFIKGTAIANCDGSDDSIYLHDMRYAESLAVHNGFLHVDTFSNIYNNTAYSVINAINEGRTFVLYRGNANTHWYDPFDVDPNLTSNGEKLPIIISATCQTISHNSIPVLGENFLRTGDVQHLKGAVGFYGGTRNANNVAHLRSAVACGFFDALFIDKKLTFGEVGEAGRYRVYQQYGEVREYNNFTCLGDPELNLWTAYPCSVIVTHPQSIHFGYDQFDVGVFNAQTADPINNARVCIAGNIDTTVYVLDSTDTTGYVTFSINPTVINDTIFVTVTGTNLQPYEGFMRVYFSNSPYVIYLKSTIEDTITGNGDHNINPTEEINLPLWVQNLSDTPAVNVKGLLRISDPYISITDSLKTFDDIPGNDSAYTGIDGYRFSVAYSCPDQHMLYFQLACSDANDSVWTSNFQYKVSAPELSFVSYEITGGNGNDIVEPAETVNVTVTLKNSGSAGADSTIALLQPLSPGVYLIDSTADFGYIGPDSFANNSLNPFIIAVDSQTTPGTILDFQLIVSSNYCEHTDTFTIPVGRFDYLIWNPDPTPASGENIYALLNSLGYYGDYSINLPTNLERYRVIFVCVGVYPNKYIIASNSPEASALVEFLNQEGKLYIEGGDVWFYDPQHQGGYDFCSLFGINPTSDGSSNMGPVVGISGTFTQDMNFTYSGENNWMDHISPTGSGAFLIFRDGNDNYDCGVANSTDTYRTVGVSFELGLLNDSIEPSTRTALLDSIMHFFGIGVGINEDSQGRNISHPFDLQINPNPSRNKIIISYTGINPKNAHIKVYDATGRLIRDFTSPQKNRLIWDGVDNSGKSLPAGIYFINLEAGNYKKIKKAVLLK